MQFGSLSIVTCFLHFYIDLLSNAFVLYTLTFYVVPNFAMNQEWKFCILVLGYVVYISNFYLLDVIVINFIFDDFDFCLVFFCIFYNTPMSCPA
jgi:hypothetical protein